MKHWFFPRLALTNIKNNKRTYLPYFITCVGTALMFYNLCALALHPDTGLGTVAIFMMLGVVVTALFATAFLFYTNSFLVKRRKKEFGLLNILGLEKKHIGIVMLWETVFVGIGSIVTGVALGILFNKLITMLLYKIINRSIIYGFTISGKAILATALLFAFVFLLNLLSSLWQIKRSNPVQLLQGSAVGEKEPKSNWFLTIIGVLALSTGYIIALTASNVMDIVLGFLTAVVLVMIGTYCLFTAGSVVLLKLLKKNKNYYYQTKHFISLSGMIYRMKKNAVGLANICIMSTAVLVVISTTVSLYIGSEDQLLKRYPTEAIIGISSQPSARPDKAQFEASVQSILKRDAMGYTQMKGYEYLSFTAINGENGYAPQASNNNAASSNVVFMVAMTAENYAQLSGEAVQLQDNQALVYANKPMGDITIVGKTYEVQMLKQQPDIGRLRAYITDLVYVIVNSEDIVNEMYQAQFEAYKDNASALNYELVFDFDAEDKAVVEYCQNSFFNEVNAISHEGGYLSIDIRAIQRADSIDLFGGLFFIGIFIGILFLTATVLVMYYKQVVEGLEDRERFKIMQNVGLSKAEVKQSIGSQVLTVFVLPLAAAIVHIAVAFPVLTKLLKALQLSNVAVFAMCTVVTALVFAIAYAVVYVLTSRVYYKIVNG